MCRGLLCSLPTLPGRQRPTFSRELSATPLGTVESLHKNHRRNKGPAGRGGGRKHWGHGPLKFPQENLRGLSQPSSCGLLARTAREAKFWCSQ